MQMNPSTRRPCFLGFALMLLVLGQGQASAQSKSALPAAPNPQSFVSPIGVFAGPRALPPAAGKEVFRIEDTKAAAAAGLEPTHREGWYAVPSTEVEHDSPKARTARALASYSTPAFLDLFEELSWPNPAIFIGFEPGATPKDRASALAAAAGIVQRYSHLPDLVLVKLDTTSGDEVLARVTQLSELPGVAFAEPDMAFTGRAGMVPNDPYFPFAWHHWNTGQTGGLAGFDIKTTAAWDFGIGSSDVSVLVFETGVQLDHPDLNLRPGRDFTTGDINGIPGGVPVFPYEIHGTPVAGCISARMNNSLGVCGVAPNCPTVSARVFVGGSNGSSWTADMSWSVNALNWALANGIRITNNSNQYGFYDASAVSAAYAATRAAGAVHFAGAGNFGNTVIRFPANDASVIAVGAATRAGVRASFSSYGPKLAFMAPGSVIWSTDRTGDLGYSSGPTGDYNGFGGTSAASPVAAGVAALMRSRNPAITPDDITAIMSSTARDMGVPGFDTDTGWGLIDAAAAVAAVVPAPYAPCVSSNPILIQGLNSPVLNQTTAANLDLGGSNCAFTIRKANFFSFTPPQTGNYTFSTCASGVDTRMAVVTDCANPSGTLLACNDSSACGSPAAITVALVEGSTVYVVIGGGGASDLPSPFNLSIEAPRVPACISSTAALFGDNAFSTAAATSDQRVKRSAGGTDFAVIFKAAWYSFTPSVTGAYRFKTCGASGDTALAIGVACPDADSVFQCLAYNDDAPTCFIGTNATGSWIDVTNNGATGDWAGFPLAQDLIAGVTYYICVGGHAPYTGSLTGLLIIDGPPQPPPPSPDLNGDGSVNGADLAMLLSAWGLPGATDIDRDGTTGGADLALVLSAWTG